VKRVKGGSREPPNLGMTYKEAPESLLTEINNKEAPENLLARE